jgi:hypothetical protein
MTTFKNSILLASKKAKKHSKRITYALGETIQVFRIGTTVNKKICKDPKQQIVQTYTFSKAQLELVINAQETGVKFKMSEFFALDKANCGNCPFSGNMGKVGLCYTHKFQQYTGFLAMLNSIATQFKTVDSIPKLTPELSADIVRKSTNKYVRFGTYGEPTEIPLQLVSDVVNVSSNHTGYTHQYFRKIDYAPFFMASVHNSKQAKTARTKFGYSSFIAATPEKNDGIKAIICPASKEGGDTTDCKSCGLCSGFSKIDVKINLH